MDIDSDVQIRNFGGTQDLREFLLAFKDLTRFSDIVKRVGIVRDAETDFDSALASVRSSFENANLPVPEFHGYFTNSSPAVGAMILPGENQNGMLETLLCMSISGCEIDDCINQFFECVEDKAGINIRRREKARARVYFATRLDPHLSVGVAAKRGYWNLNHGAFEGVRNFLCELANHDCD